jgi:hypothetical protein
LEPGEEQEKISIDAVLTAPCFIAYVSTHQWEIVKVIEDRQQTEYTQQQEREYRLIQGIEHVFDELAYETENT